MNSPNSRTREIVFAVALALTAASSPGTFDFRHGVVVDGRRGAAYVGGAKGDVLAVDLASGRTLWRSAHAALPLALRGSLIAAQAEHDGPLLRIVVLDAAKNGRRVAESTTPLPEGVRALVSDDLGQSFRATAKYEGDGFVVSWIYRETIIQGIARQPGEPPPERTLSGTTFVRARSLGASTPPRGACSTAPVAERLKTGRLPHPPWRAGNVLAVAAGGRGGPLILLRWNACSGAPLPDRPLSDAALTALVSADTRHLLVVERVGKGTPMDPEYRWSVVALETGQTIGQVLRNSSAAPFFVWKGIVVFVSQPHGFLRGREWVNVPLEIVAIRLSTGDIAWRRPVRDLDYRGPMPPAS